MGILLAEVGGTKSEWWYAETDGEEPIMYTEVGFHPLWEGNVLEQTILPAVKTKLEDRLLDHIYYYGTGVADPGIRSNVAQTIRDVLKVLSVEVESDVLGAGRSISDGRRSIVGILGTGSNSGLFGGKDFEMNLPSLGLIAGDEGSGAYLGKLLIQAWMYEELSVEISNSLEAFLERDKSSYIRDLYITKAPGRMLASLAFFIMEHAEFEEIRQLINQNFDLFITRIIKKYPDAEHLDINFVGSFAWHFRAYLTERVQVSGLKMGMVIEKPGRSLLNFHLKRYKQ